MFEPARTPKARLEGPPDAVAQAAERLSPALGPAQRLPDGLGWNIPRALFERLEPLAAGGALGRAGPHAHRLLLPADAAAPARLQRHGRDLRFVSYGRPFRLAPRQRPADGDPSLAAGDRVRFAYYSTGAPAGRSNSSPQP